MKKKKEKKLMQNEKNGNMPRRLFGKKRKKMADDFK